MLLQIISLMLVGLVLLILRKQYANQGWFEMQMLIIIAVEVIRSATSSPHTSFSNQLFRFSDFGSVSGAVGFSVCDMEE